MPDIINVGTAANTGNGATLRAGLQAANAEFARLAALALYNGTLYTSRGAWLTATSYSVNDLVVESATVYSCLTAHTSGVFATDAAAGKWTVHQGITAAELAASNGSDLIGYGAGTVQDDLDAARPIARGGTGATTVAGALANLGLIDVAGALTLNTGSTLTGTALGKCLLITDSGSPANYTTTLPAGAAVGSLIMFRVSSTATKLFTLNGNDVGIDGEATRVLWRGESCLLMREASNWTKIGGRTIPFRGFLQRASSQSITAGTTWQKATLTAESGDTYALNLCFDSVNGRFSAPRRGSYDFAGYCSVAATVTVAAAFADIGIGLNSTIPTNVPGSVIQSIYAIGQARSTLNAAAQACPMSAGQYAELYARIHSSGGTITTPTLEYVAGTSITGFSYSEVPLW